MVKKRKYTGRCRSTEEARANRLYKTINLLKGWGKQPLIYILLSYTFTYYAWCALCIICIFRKGGIRMILNVGEIVKQCRKKMKWSQEELAFNTNLSQSTVSRLEKNKISCDVNTLMQIANKTNAQDVLMAMMFNIDMGLVTQMLQLLPTFIGGLFIWTV